MKQKLKTKYGLPSEVIFCTNCVMSNQRPASSVEFKHTATSRKITLNIGSDGICDACRYAREKEKVNWNDREKELIKLLRKYRKKNGDYDCIISGSGGKDSAMASYLLKYKYDMHPLTVTWPPVMYTDYGYRNFRNWIDIGGFDNISYNRNGKVSKILTRLSIENLLHPFQTFILGQKNLAPKIALKFGIPLIFFGENEAEYGNPIADNATSLRDKSYYGAKNPHEMYLGGVSVPDLIKKYNFSLSDLSPYLPADYKELDKSKIEVRYLGYYIKWIPQEAYYFAVEHTGYKARPYRTQGTYSKYNSIDDKIDDLHYYTTFIKFGIGRATYDASQEIRNRHLTREEGKTLVKRFDGEFPDKYFHEVMDFIGMKPEKFISLCDEFRSPHLWKKVKGLWKLRHTVNEDGTDDG